MPTVRHTKSFKKYSDEARLEVVDATRSWAEARPDRFQVYEDASLIKVTATQDEVEELVTYLRGRFGTPLPGEDPPKDAKK
ncbi:MAG: hypothetical protein KDB53_07655 [Planctomycetes bacterium]|nr:hypothetical protein [Planctomycetota bacterium]